MRSDEWILMKFVGEVVDRHGGHVVFDLDADLQLLHKYASGRLKEV